MLLSRYLFTILVTIVTNIIYKPCKTINNLNHVNQIKTSFLQRSVTGPDTPESVKAGETVDVVSNKLDDLKAGNATDVKSKISTEEVKKHDQDKSTVELAPKEKEATEEKGNVSESGDSDAKNEDAGVDVKPSEDKEADVQAHTDDTVKEKAPESEGSDATVKEDHGVAASKQDDDHGHDDQEELDEDHSESNPVNEDEHAEDHKDEAEESKEHTETAEVTPKPGEGDHKQEVVDTQGDNSEDKKFEEASETTATKDDTEKHEENTESASKEHVENNSSPEAKPEAPAPEHTEEAKESAPEHSEAPTAQPHATEEHGPSTSVEVVHEGVASVDQHTQAGHSPEVAASPLLVATQPSTSTQSEVAAHVPSNADHQPAPQTEGTSVQNQGEANSGAHTTQAPVALDLNSLKDDEKEKVVKLWSKPSGDCSVDCSHSCKSSLTPSTQCVNQQGTSLSCAPFADSKSLTCPNGFTPCTQPAVTSLKSYTVKSGTQEVGALEVDGSNFNKCMGLVLTTPNGVCDKEHLVANFLFTHNVLNMDYEISVAADKLTFSNLKIKNGDYKVCLFQRHEGSLEGMTLALIWEKLLNFINPTSTTPEVKTVFVLDVGTLNVSD